MNRKQMKQFSPPVVQSIKLLHMWGHHEVKRTLYSLLPFFFPSLKTISGHRYRGEEQKEAAITNSVQVCP